GSQPPLGVTETTQPSLSTVSTLVVPSRKVRSNSASAVGLHWFGLESLPCLTVRHASNCALNGLVSPWNGYGSPGRMSGSLRSSLISLARSRAYSFESSPLIGSSGGKRESP